MIKITTKTRKLSNKSGKCYCPICNKQDILVNHHINGRNIPNANHPSNQANICSHCHTNIHYGLIVVERWVKSTEGMILLWHKKDEKSFTGQDSTPPLLI